MSTSAVLTRLGAFEATQHVDRLANLIELEASILGIDEALQKQAIDVLDKVSDAVEAKAASNFPLVAGELPPALQKINDERAEEKDSKREATFDPGTIAEQVPGPLESDSDESYMNGHFTQADLYEMTEEFGGRLASAASNLKDLSKKASALQAQIDATVAPLVTAKAALDSDPKKATESLKTALADLRSRKAATAPVASSHGFNLFKV